MYNSRNIVPGIPNNGKALFSTGQRGYPESDTHATHEKKITYF